MSAQFGLYLGDDRIPVINWINRHGSPEGKRLRFTVPTEVKAKLEANLGATYRLERDGEQWEFELLSITQHGTGTNGVPTVGQVKRAPQPHPLKARPGTGVGIPKLDGLSEPGEPVSEEDLKSNLKELLLKKKAERQTQQGVGVAPNPKTVDGLPSADDEDPPTAKGMPPVATTEEE